MQTEFPIWIFIFAIATGGLLLVGVLCSLITKHVAKSRELSHLERMKALELGQAIGPSETEKRQAKYLHNVFWICFWLGAGVPIATTSAASTVMIQTHLQEFRIILAIWIGAAVISVSSIVCATVLMVSGRQRSSKNDKDSSESGNTAKQRDVSATP